MNLKNPKGKKYDYDRTFFEKIDTPEKAYYFGWIVTDGHLKDKTSQRQVTLNIQARDIIVLENFVDLVGGSRKQIRKRKQNMRSLTFSSKQMVEDLKKNGIPSGKKTFIVKFPKVRKDLLPHFIRGCIEGDGTFVYSSRTPPALKLGFAGTKDMCINFSKTLSLNGDFVCPKQSYFYFQKTYTSSEDILKLYNYLYQNCGKYYLPRKREKIVEIYKERVSWENRQKSKKTTNLEVVKL